MPREGWSLRDVSSPRSQTLERFQWSQGDLQLKEETNLKLALAAAGVPSKQRGLFVTRSDRLHSTGKFPLESTFAGLAAHPACFPHTMGGGCCQEK